MLGPMEVFVVVAMITKLVHAPRAPRDNEARERTTSKIDDGSAAVGRMAFIPH